MQLSTKHFLIPAQCILPSAALPSGCRTGTEGAQERDTTQIPSFFSKTAELAVFHYFWLEQEQIKSSVQSLLTIVN